MEKELKRFILVVTIGLAMISILTMTAKQLVEDGVTSDIAMNYSAIDGKLAFAFFFCTVLFSVLMAVFRNRAQKNSSIQ